MDKKKILKGVAIGMAISVGVILACIIILYISGITITDVCEKLYTQYTGEQVQTGEAVNEPSEEENTPQHFLDRTFVSDNNIKYFVYNSIPYKEIYALNMNVVLEFDDLTLYNVTNAVVDKKNNIARYGRIQSGEYFYIAENDAITTVYLKDENGYNDIEVPHNKSKMLTPELCTNAISDMENITYELVGDNELIVKGLINIKEIYNEYNEALELFNNEYDENKKVPVEFRITMTEDANAEEGYHLETVKMRIALTDIKEAIKVYKDTMEKNKEAVDLKSMYLEIIFMEPDVDKLELPKIE